MGINSDGNVFVGQTPTYVAGATQLVVRGKTGAGFVGVNHYDMSIKGGMNTFNYVFQVGTSTFHSMAFLVEDIERGRVNSSGRLLWGTTTDNTTDLVQINGSLIATSIKKSGGTSSQFLKADGSVDSTTYGTGTVTSVAMSVPTGLSINGSPITTSGTLALSLSAGYSIPTTSSQGTWDTAYNRSLTSIGVSGTTTKTLTLTKQDGTTLTASWSDINTDAVTSVFGRTGAIVATGGDYTTAQVTESGNLYYLDSRARASISGGTGISYNSTTGVITNTITQYTDALARASISGGTGISYNSTSGVITNTITQYTDALARASLSFVAGSGAYNSTTGVITIPTNTSQLTNGAGYITGITSLMVTNALGYTPVTNARQLTINGTTYDLSADRSWTISGTIGGLTSGFIPKATSASTLGNSLIYDDGSGVGIGTTSPVQKLEVVGNIKTGSDNFTNVNGGWFFNGNGSYANGIFAYNTSNNLRLVAPTQIEFTIGFSEIMRLTAGGNFLVGTTTDSGYKLDVNGTGRFSGYVNVNGASTLEALNVNGNIWLAGTANRYIRLQSATNYYYNLQSFNDDFRIVEAGSIPRLVITYPNGNVGIGTISPGNKLSVVGATNIRDFLLIDNSQSYFGDNGSVSTGTADGNTLIQYYTTKYLTFKQSGFERMRLDASGNLGLGVTPSAWGGGSVGLDIGGDPFSGINGSLRLALTTNAYAIGATYYYRLSGLSSQQYRLSVGTNNHEWYNAPSGTAGGVISYTQAMTLTSGGNLLVGTTTDNGSRLQVQGNVRFNYSDNFGYFGIGYISAANYGFYNYNYGRADLLFTQATGAATFSSTVTAGGRYIVSVSSSAGISDISYGSYSGGAFINTPSATIGYLAAAGTQALAWDSNNVIFYTNSGNERMRIVQSGNVGIGTSSPSYALDVYNTGASLARVRVVGTTNFSLLQAQNDSGVLYMGIDSSTGGGFGIGNYTRLIWSSGAYPLVFAVNDAQRMRITSGGNVLIGTTTDAGYKLDVNGTGRFSGNVAIGTTLNSWSSGYRALNIGAGFGIMASATNWDGYICSNTYYNGTNWVVSNSASIVPIILEVSNGFKVQIGTTNSIGSVTTLSTILNIASTGAATFSSSVTATSFFESSDKTIKTLITDNYLVNGIESITAKLYTKHGKEELGYFAQDVQGILPSAVTKGTNGLLNLSYREVLVAKVQSLEQRVKELETQLNLG
jgi:hypothetical protein